MTAIYEFQIKQRGGKWVPQCQKSAADAWSTWRRMLRMKRKLRCVKIEDGVRTIVARYPGVLQ